MSVPEGFTRRPELDGPSGIMITCDICDLAFSWLDGPEQEELPAHLAEHEVPEEEPLNPFEGWDEETMLAWLQTTALRDIPQSIRQMLLDKCNELEIQINPYDGWLEGALAP
jgi:hypothetical protein